MILILFCVILSIIGQLLLKKGMMQIGGYKGEMIMFLKKVIATPLIWVAIVLYGLDLVLWLIVLSHFPLGYAYLFLALTYIGIPLSSTFFLGESLSIAQIIGMILIACGVAIVGLGK